MMRWSEWTPKKVRVFFEEEWRAFDTYAMDAYDIFSRKTSAVHWYMKVTPPIPTRWPPQGHRNFTYYAIAEYQQARMHGPHLSRSAPWAKVTVEDDAIAEMIMISKAIEGVRHDEAGVPISQQLAKRKIQIIEEGEALLSSFTQWTCLPESKSVIEIIKNYYCQWALTDQTANLIKNDHLAFFDWLSCPPATHIPVIM